MRASLPILTFHSVDDQSSVLSFAPRLFARALGALHEHGYRTLKLMEAVELLRNGIRFPDRSFVITFDDGYQNVYEEAFPVLQRYGMSATIFLTVGDGVSTRSSARMPSMEGRPMLAWSEVREMHDTGSITFGAHTLSHPDLTRLPSNRLEREICDSKTAIENELGAPVHSFAYPYGRYDERSREIVRGHFDFAVSDKLGLTTSTADLYAIERVDSYYLRTDRLFELMLTRLFPGYIWARSIPRGIRRALFAK